MSKRSENTFCRPENLTLFHYGELDAADRLLAEQHLRDCAACRRELAHLRSTLERLPKMEPEFSPREIRAFAERVGRRIRPKPRRIVKPAFGWSLAATAAMLLMLTLHSPAPGPQQASREVVLRSGPEMERLPEADMLLNLDLLENLDLLQQLEETGIGG